MAKTSTSILSTAYKSVTANFNMTKYKRYISSFLEARSTELYDTCPCDRIFFRSTDYELYWSGTGMKEDVMKTSIDSTYYGSMRDFNPRAAKDPLTIAQICIIRMFLLKGDIKEAQLGGVYLSFTGKFYPSIHYASYPKTPPSQYRHVMEYVVNNKLSNSYDLKTEGSVFGAINALVGTWLTTYKDKFKSFKDDDVVYIIQQLHTRIKSFTINIAKLYYETYNNKNEYMSYGQDNLSDENNYVLTDSDTLLMERIVQKALESINSKGINYKICMEASDYNVRVNEVKSIMETIITDPEQQPVIKEFLTLLVAIYFRESPDKDINNIKFVTVCVRSKSNTKDPHLVRSKEIVETWLEEGSPAYRKRRKRIETKASYVRSVYAYFALTIYYANK